MCITILQNRFRSTIHDAGESYCNIIHDSGESWYIKLSSAEH